MLFRSAKQIREQRGITGNLRDFLTADELDAISNMEQLVIKLLDNGGTYPDIKPIVMQFGSIHQKRLSA